ncbi:chemotaxis protein CheB [Croceicoccus gelatinilyticus]|uniref:chemotaxis protein CheB n=1 Tax=Croceicoccus gelatinilyticus TaxID=2835536 RepID=UPI001BCEB076|nr:PAS domain-containing protein [Croceicoccus gelatinilyticus]
MTEEQSEGSTEFDHPVVAVGASAGGVEALKAFVAELPADTPASFIILQHLAPDHDSQLADILARAAKLPVSEADENMPVEKGHIYVLTPDRYLTIIDHGLFVEPPTQPRGLRMPIDHFMRSLADAAASRAVGVVLSGTGNDGCAGLKAIKGTGGLALAQDPETALYDGMPRAAIDAGVVDSVGDIPAMCSQIVELSHRLKDNPQDGDFSRSDLNGVLALLKTRMGHDFAAYKSGTIGRRVRRRMNLLRFDTVGDYLQHLRANADEMHHLFDDLLINVTCFFRDGGVWDAVVEKVLSPLVKDRSEAGEAVRIWVPACSSGEEAFTLAILMDELVDGSEKPCDWQIFATDLDQAAIAKGREGHYRANIADDVGPARLQKFFQREGDGYRIRKRLREKVVFAQQNVLTDPPFSRLDLVSCRNLLIYLDNKHQEQLLETFHFALREGGFLLLGTSESSGSRQREFRTMDSKAHIYARKPGKSLARLSPRVDSALAEGLATMPRNSRRERERDLSSQVRRSLIDRYAPAAIAVKADGEIAYFHGPVRKFIDHQEGSPSHSIFDLLPSPLRSRTREAIKAVSSGDTPAHKSVRIRYPDRDASVCIECVEIVADGDRLFLLTFIEHDEKEAPASRSADDDGKYVRQLENELAIVQEDLQTTVEELETSNEELKASHEEAVAANEELQSANEELETSREELQSLNEELVTVNNQLEEKINEVERASDDLQNLLTSTRLPVLFLGPELKISGFTPSMRELVEVRDADIGRPVTELAFKAQDPDLLADVDRTMTSLALSEKQIGTNDRKTFIRRIQPYRTSDERIQGVVVTYSDITEQAEISSRLSDREKQQRIIAELGQKGLAARDLDKFVNELCATLRVALDCDHAKVLEYDGKADKLTMIGGAGWKSGLVGSATVPASVKSQAGYTIDQGQVLVTDFAEERRFEPPQLLIDHEVVSGVSCRIDIGGKPWGVLGLHDRDPHHFRSEDVLIVQAAANVAAATIKQILREQQTARESLVLSLAIKTAEMGVWQFDPETRGVVWDERLREMIGKQRSRSQPTADAFFGMMHPDDLERVQTALNRTIEEGVAFKEEFRLTRPDEREIWLIGRGERIVEGDRSTVVGINADITDRKVAEEQNRFVMRELDHRVKNVLAIILSIAKITGANAEDFATFIGSFDKRLHAMARTHSLLAEARWQGARLRSLVTDELAHSSENNEIVVDGPDVDLSPASAQNLSMALHELATNALKYGSLSVPGGKLSIGWSWESREAEERVLLFQWKETGGPRVTAPHKKGFGSTVIERILRAQLGAESKIEYDPDGLDVICRIPASRIVPGGRVGDSTAIPTTTVPHIDLDPIKNAHILVVDDEWLVAEQHAQALAGAGATVVGPFHTLDDAEQAAKEHLIDFAVLDYNIDGTAVSPLVDLLETKGIPVLIVSGYGSELELADKLDHLAFLAKPVSPAAMLGRVAQLISRKDGN